SPTDRPATGHPATRRARNEPRPRLIVRRSGAPAMTNCAKRTQLCRNGRATRRGEATKRTQHLPKWQLRATKASKRTQDDGCRSEKTLVMRAASDNPARAVGATATIAEVMTAGSDRRTRQVIRWGP